MIRPKWVGKVCSKVYPYEDSRTGNVQTRQYATSFESYHFVYTKHMGQGRVQVISLILADTFVSSYDSPVHVSWESALNDTRSNHSN